MGIFRRFFQINKDFTKSTNFSSALITTLVIERYLNDNYTYTHIFLPHSIFMSLNNKHIFLFYYSIAITFDMCYYYTHKVPKHLGNR